MFCSERYIPFGGLSPWATASKSLFPQRLKVFRLRLNGAAGFLLRGVRVPRICFCVVVIHAGVGQPGVEHGAQFIVSGVLQGGEQLYADQV